MLQTLNLKELICDQNNSESICYKHQT